MNRSRTRAIVSIAFFATSCALFGCGGGGSDSGAPAQMPPPPNPTSTSLEVFVRDLMNGDQSAPPKEINDVPFTNEVHDDTFDDVFPA